jgi:hypothetical protein
MMPGSMHTQVQCPVCHITFPVQLEQVVDVGSDPTAKERLLSGRVNVADCPQCGSQGMLSTPLLYHDPAHEMLLVFVPMELNLAQNQREQLIGSLTRDLMSRIPAEARKGYLFSPQTVLTFENMIERILQAEGVPGEVLEKQRKQGRLLQQFVGATDAEIQGLVKEHDDEIDETFFLMLSAEIESARRSNRQDRAANMIRLRDRLLVLASWSRQRGITPDQLGAQQARLELIERFLETQESDWPSLAQENDAKLDYLFFQLLTAVAEQEDEGSAAQLLHLRSRLTDLSSVGRTAKARQEAVHGLQEAATAAGGLTREMLLERLLAARDDQALEALAEAGSPALDYSFFILMADRIEAAEKSGDAKMVTRLLDIRGRLLALTDKWEKARSARVNQVGRQLDALLQAPDPEDAVQHLLPEVDELFLSVLSSHIEAAKKAGKDDTAARLEGLMSRIVAEIRRRIPPGIELINELVEQEDEASMRQLLAERRSELTPEILEVLERLHDDLHSSGDGELVTRVARILELATEYAPGQSEA